MTLNKETVLQNEVHKILWDLELQTDHLISARKPNLMAFDVPDDHRVKKKAKW